MSKYTVCTNTDKELWRKDDPKLLRTRIAELEREVKSRPTETSKEKRVEVPVIKEIDRKWLHHSFNELRIKLAETRDSNKRAVKVYESMEKDFQTFERGLNQIAAAITVKTNPTPQPHWEIPNQKSKLTMVDKKPVSSEVKLPIGETKILSAIIQNHGCTRQQITVLTGYKRSSRDAYLQRLSVKGLVEISGDQVYATAQGSVAVEVEALPTGPELRDYWLNKLP